MVRQPVVNEEKVSVQFSRETKVMLHHLSAIDDRMIEEYIDLGLDYIWKTMHCNNIRINLHYYLQPDEKNPGKEKLKNNEVLKLIFKKRVFRWKTLKNELNGMRIETWEGANLGFKEQLKPESAFIYRRGLSKADLTKETFSLGIKNVIRMGEKP